jgi:hypothetical protein
MNKEGNDLISSRRSVQAILARNQSIAGLSKEYERALPYIDELQKINFIVASEDIITIISLLEKTAQDTGNAQTVQMKESMPESIISSILGVPVNKMNYTITLNGDYDSFLRYVKKIEKLSYYININSINTYGPVDVDKNSQTVIGVSFYIKK